MTIFNHSGTQISYRLAKRLFDIVFSLAVLICGSPIYFVIAILIKCSSKGPVFFKSSRVGIGCKPIGCLKFRSMYIGAEEKLKELLNQNDEMRMEWERFHKLKKDPRITTIGRFLRRTSLDELPQFFNVLKGELSVVGPRPFLYDMEELRNCLGNKMEKFVSAKPGITGLWQVSGRNLLTVEEKLRLEEYYIENRSFLFDLTLVLKTIPVFFSHKGAF